MIREDTTDSDSEEEIDAGVDARKQRTQAILDSEDDTSNDSPDQLVAPAEVTPVVPRRMSVITTPIPPKSALKSTSVTPVSAMKDPNRDKHRTPNAHRTRHTPHRRLTQAIVPPTPRQRSHRRPRPVTLRSVYEGTPHPIPFPPTAMTCTGRARPTA